VDLSSTQGALCTVSVFYILLIWGCIRTPLPPGLAALLNELTYCIVVSSTVALVGSLMSSSGHNQSQQAYTKFNNEGTKNLKRMHGFFAHYSGTAGTRLALKCTRGVPCVLRKVAGAF